MELRGGSRVFDFCFLKGLRNERVGDIKRMNRINRKWIGLVVDLKLRLEMVVMRVIGKGWG